MITLIKIIIFCYLDKKAILLHESLEGITKVKTYEGNTFNLKLEKLPNKGTAQ